ncbi:hypothetical protein TanjilG_26501 [Lupinus angustifolius]|uniref:Uncharacterized protein n=1 Tax=Lupinus angustifolius TaxID=3871 RepID=A0A4P1QPW7_LUPAN|nr:PREDICTED: uncharacterized protein LOC109334639 isoform X1 [Lupinus angustifolius]OIV91648.1 hypothetical protein TanjilG_26501 [Lupinus angustifolius]
MQTINRLISSTRKLSLRHETPLHLITLPSRTFSSSSSGSDPNLPPPLNDDDIGWDTPSSWTTGFATDHFNGQPSTPSPSPTTAVVSAAVAPSPKPNKVLSDLQETEDKLKELEAENRKSKGFVDGWKERMLETATYLKQVQEPGARGSYLKDSEKAEMYRLHKKDPQVYTVEKLAKDYRIMRQRVHAILWLKELEEEEEKKLGCPLDDSVEILLDSFPEFFNSHDREFHVASLPYKPDFKVMPEGWDGITKDRDEVHYEISKKEDDMLYREFVEKINFNKKKFAGEVKTHRYSRRRPSDGWTFTVEKIGPRGKRGDGGGWKFASMPDGSTRPLNETEKMYVRRETPRRRRRILP